MSKITQSRSPAADPIRRPTSNGRQSRPRELRTGCCAAVAASVAGSAVRDRAKSTRCGVAAARVGVTGPPALAPPLDRNDGPSPRAAPAASAASLSTVDRVFLYPAHIDIPPNLGSPIVEDGFEVKSTAGCIIYTCPYGTRRRQEVTPRRSMSQSWAPT